MTNNLPDGIYYLSGSDALLLEKSRRDFIDAFTQNGYSLVLPPPINFASHGSSFKFSDSNSNKTLEIVADITRQVAIIDSKSEQNINKYCYCNQIVKPFADDFYSSRNPTQAGCEIYGDSSTDADIEIIENLTRSLTLLGVKNINITLSDLEIIIAIIANLDLKEHTKELITIINNRSTTDMLDFINDNNITYAEQLLSIMSGDSENILHTCNAIISNGVREKIKQLQALQHTLSDAITNASFIVNIADTSNSTYHNGLLFSAYGEGFSKAIARGGRYNNFINQKTAVGFSFELNFILV